MVHYIPRRLRPVFLTGLLVAFLLIMIGTVLVLVKSGMQPVEYSSTADQTTTVSTTTTATTAATTLYPLKATRTTETAALTDMSLIRGRNAVLIAVRESGNVLLAERGADARIYPASMTKIMTMLTFIRLGGTEDLDKTVTMTQEILDYAKKKHAACAGFRAGESCTVRDLLHGLMLPSGADAALMLAVAASGSEAAFADEMNAYAKEMGLTDTHFVNCTGLHDENHYSTPQEIAVMLGYAVQNDLCAALMSAQAYVTAPNAYHAGGLELKSAVFSRMTGLELREQTGLPITVRGGKTGFTNEAGQCLATWAVADDGSRYLAVVAGCDGLRPLDAVADTLTLYQLVYGSAAAVTRLTAAADAVTTTTQPDAADPPVQSSASQSTVPSAAPPVTTTAPPAVTTAPSVTETAPQETQEPSLPQITAAAEAA